MEKKNLQYKTGRYSKDLRKKGLSIRVDEETKKEWEEYVQKHKFSSLSSFIRYCASEIIEKKSHDNQRSEDLTELKKKIKEMEEENIKTNIETRNILKEIVLNLAGKPSPNNELLKGYQMKIMLRSLNTKKGKTINELVNDLCISEYMVLDLINELLEENRIIEEDDRYKVIY